MSLYILDTDHVTLHQHGHTQTIAAVHRHISDGVAITVVTVEEQMRGRLAQIGRPGVNVALAYDQLKATAQYFCDLRVLPFDAAAQHLFQRLRMQNVRISTLDLRIAAIALRQDAVLVTRNMRDFKQVPGLLVEDWST